MEHERIAFMQRKNRKSSLEICILNTHTHKEKSIKSFFSPET
jgi:hypothetical protein